MGQWPLIEENLMSNDLLFGTTVQVTSDKRGTAAAQAWIDKAAESDITATLAGVPVDGFPDGNNGLLLALVKVDGADVVLTISNIDGDTRTVAAREPRGQEVSFFSDLNL